ncbi:hypothetical protein ACSQ67_003480 [Phaseolus vulgaris]
MSVSNGNNGLRFERGKLVAPNTLREVIIMLADAITKLCETEKKYMFYLPIAIAHAVLDKGKKTIGRECRERSDCVEVKGPQIVKELYELKRMLTCAKIFSICKRSLPVLLLAGFEKEDILYRKRTAREKHVNIPNIYPSVSPVTTSARRRLYPPGRIMHMIPSDMPENSTSNHSEADENHVCLLYQTPTELYGKLRLSRGMIMDHPSTKYLKKLQQLINKLEKE